MSFERRDIKDIFKSSLNKCMQYWGTDKQKEIKISSNFCEISLKNYVLTQKYTVKVEIETKSL